MALPSHPSVANIIDQQSLKHIKKGAILINVGRGMNIDEEALIEAIIDRDIKVGLDVTQ